MILINMFRWVINQLITRGPHPVVILVTYLLTHLKKASCTSQWRQRFSQQPDIRGLTLVPREFMVLMAWVKGFSVHSETIIVISFKSRAIQRSRNHLNIKWEMDTFHFWNYFSFGHHESTQHQHQPCLMATLQRDRSSIHPTLQGVRC